MAITHASKHNEAMFYIFNRLETVPRENVEAVVAGIYGDFCTENGLPWPFGPFYPPTFPMDFNQIDLRAQIDGSENSEALKEAARQLIAIVELELRYHDFDTELNNLVANQEGRLEGDDVSKLEDMVSVARQSYQLYISESGEPTEFLQLAGSVPGGNTGGNAAASVNGWKVLACDGIGGLVSGPAGFLGASAISIIMQL